MATGPEPRTIPELFFRRVQDSPNGLAYRYSRDGRVTEVTWREYGELVRRFANGLLSLGFEKGDRCAILGETQPEWTIADLAAMAAGGTGVGIYQTNTAKQTEYILQHSEAKVCVLDTRAQAQKVAASLVNLPRLKTVVAWGDGIGDGIISFDEILRKGDEFAKIHPNVLEQRMKAVRGEDLAILIYTSGTTGPPKGAMLSHRNCVFEICSLERIIPSSVGDITVAFLPMSHVAEHLIGFVGRIRNGMAAAYAESLDKVLDTVKATRPTVFGSVPRIFEKAYARILSQVGQASPLKRRIFEWAKRTGLEKSRRLQQRQSVPLGLAIRYAVADRLVFSKIREAFGGRVKYFVSGAAPISTEILEFFHAAGLFVAEVYGLTECAAIATANRFDDFKFGTVGKVIPDVEVKIAPDGEILMRGPNIFMGYFKDDVATHEAIEKNGWLHSGDIGVLDTDGFLKITDRKKNLIITAGGKNIAPSNIETLVKNQSPLISQVVAIGDRRAFVVGLITLSPDELKAYGAEKGWEGASPAELSRRPEVQATVAAAVERANAELARYEQIKKFSVLEADFTVESGEITPTLKVKRKVVEEKYREKIESLYREGV
ncbi:MAG: long-chain fatty acid--CoA ligase [Nitrospirae bacterium]|nr:long-chain fatty acid--CoA ligase [Nitrospirota bacterium]